RSFFNMIALDKKNFNYHSVLENMNSGFISVENYKLKYVNNTLFQTIVKNKSLQNIVTLETNSDKLPTYEELISLSKGNIYLVLKELFNGLVLDGKQFNNNEDVFENILEILKSSTHSEEFVFLGSKKLMLNEEEDEPDTIHYEIFGRCYSDLSIVNNIIKK